MKYLAQIFESDKQAKPNNSFLAKYTFRNAVRVILSDEKFIALLDVVNDRYHKLPGGGIEADERRPQAIKREVMEETGFHCGIDDFLGKTIQYKEKLGLAQIDFVYRAHVLGLPQNTAYEPQELAAGFKLTWVTLKQAIDQLENDHPDDYHGKFIVKRDKAILYSILSLQNN